MDDDLRSRIEAVEEQVVLLEGVCDRLDPDVSEPWRYPGRSYSHKADPGLGEIKPSDYTDDDLGRAQFRLAIAQRRVEWLHDVAAGLHVREETRVRAYQRATQGIGRLVGDGRYSLDDLIEATKANPAALAELQAATAAARAQQHADDLEAAEGRVEARKSP